MIAKIITHGPTRAEALMRMTRALAATQVAGSVTNHAFLRKLVAQADFVAGDVDTGLIDRNLEELAAEPVPCSRSRALAALGALGLDGARAPLAGFALWSPVEHVARLTWGDEEVTARVRVDETGFDVDLGGCCHRIEKRPDGWMIDGAKTPAEILSKGLSVSVFFGNGYHFQVVDPLDVAKGAGAAGNVIEAPMPGLVRAVFARAGQAVVAGDRLALLEAMKMEHVLVAARDGVVAEVLAGEGAQVEAGAVLIRLEEEEP